MHFKRTLSALALASAATLAVPASAHAGNGTSNFYLTDSCSSTRAFVGITKFAHSNYDTPTGQMYHYYITTSGPGILIDAVRLDGKYKGNKREGYISADDRGPHTLTVYGHIYGGLTSYQCSNRT